MTPQDNASPHIRMREFSCPHCGRSLDSLGRLTSDLPPPNEGDFAVCFGCARILVFNAHWQLEKPPAGFLDALDPAERAELMFTQKAVRWSLREQKKGRR